MTVKEKNIDSRVVKLPSGTKEWADCNVNCIKGCHNNCRYCYARLMAKRFGRPNDHWQNMQIATATIDKHYKKRNGRIMFPSTHDIFEFSPFKEACFNVLRNLVESGNSVLVTTKPRLSVVKQLVDDYQSYRTQIQFRFTITSFNDTLLQFWEPNAPSFNERLIALKYAFDNKFKTSVSIEPFLDFDPTQLIEIVEPFVTESIWLGRMNYIARKGLTDKEQIFYSSIRKNYETKHLIELCSRLAKNQKIRFKDSIKRQLQKNNKNIDLKVLR